jgi:uncharacterized protein (DUF305 family)
MESKQNTFNPTHIVVFIIIGLLAGYFIWGYKKSTPIVYNEMQMMHNSMDNMTMALGHKTGDDFDMGFIDQMVIHHQGAIDMANQVLETSKRPELIQMANEIIIAQTKEINTMNQWKSDWFK